MMTGLKKLEGLFKGIVGEENVLTDFERRYVHSFDATNICDGAEICDFVIFPKSTEEVSQILKIAYENEIPVVPKGAGTNLVGGCLLKKSGIVLDFSKADKIKKIDKENMTAIVEPGVILEDFQKEVEKHGLFYPPDPSNRAVSTIGGSVALNSGGPHSFKYGTTKDYVIGLTVVLADGKIMKTGSECMKNSTGYNLTSLFVGSEGTLGVITEITLKLIKKPENRKLYIIYFKSLHDAGEAVNNIITGMNAPAVTDLVDKNTLVTIENFIASGLKTEYEAALLIELDDESTEKSEELLLKICEKSGFVQKSDTKEEEEKIWLARRSAFGAMAQLAPSVTADDFVVPRRNIVPEIEGIKRSCEKYNLKVGIMGHIADGNIHPNIALNLENEEEKQNLLNARKEMYELTMSLGGMLSGEHGIGCEKAKYMEQNTGFEAYNCMKKLKKLFDEKNILNPGKIFN